MITIHLKHNSKWYRELFRPVFARSSRLRHREREREREREYKDLHV